MIVHLRQGIDKLKFGMQQKDVISIYGEPDKKIIDEEQNILYLYNAQKWQLTFYEDEGFKLGYIICANPNLELFGAKVIGHKIEKVTSAAEQNGVKGFEVEEFDITENHFNEDNWLILQTEFGEVVKVELGAIINSKDEFEWKF